MQIMFERFDRKDRNWEFYVSLIKWSFMVEIYLADVGFSFVIGSMRDYQVI